jgi:signal transduction histidine kinase
VHRLLRSPGGDGLLAATLAALAFVPGVAQQGLDVADIHDRPVDALGVALMLAMALPLVVRRRFPIACLTVTGAAFVAYQLLGYPISIAALGLLVALYSAGVHASHRVPAATTAALAYVAFAFAADAIGSPARLVDYVMFGVVLGACWAVGARVRARAALEQERRTRLEAEVVAAERARIARDLHDVVTHHVTAMVVQADAAAFLTDPSAVSASLTSVAGTGRHALADLRHLLGALQGGHDAPREPATGDLADLAARNGATFVEEGEVRPLDDATRMTAYRVVQEALTNALKHAAGAHTTVRVSHTDDGTDLIVTTDGTGRSSSVRGSGRGLVGMRERVALLDGSLDAGPAPDGGFVVRASIPRRP